MKTILYTFFFVFTQIISISAFAQESEIILNTKDGEISGTLNIPNTKTKVPLVLIIAGSGPTDRNGNNSEMENNSLKYLAADLAKNNIASVRYDKRGIGRSADIFEEHVRFETYINDVKSWIDKLSKDKRFSKIILAGHSEGSLLGIVAAENNKKVNGFISIAGAGRPADEILKEQLSGVVPDVKKIIYSMIDTLKKGDTIPNVQPIFYALFRRSIQPYMISWFKYDPKIEIKKLTIPILIVQGNKDIQVKVEDAELLAAAVPAAQLKIIDNMNHVLKECSDPDKEVQLKTYNDPALPLKKELVPFITEFINKL